MSNAELVAWMEAARIGPMELAVLLAENGHTITRQRISQWRAGDPISTYWQAALAQVIAQVDDADTLRAVTRRMTAETATQ